MILDLTTITSSIKDKLAPAEKADGPRLNRAINDCLDDLTDRLVSQSMLTSDTDTIAASTRTHTISGSADDLRYLFAVKYGTSDLEKTLEYVDPKEFLAKYDNPNAQAAVPSKYTILTSDAGDPVIKFNCPTSQSDTLTYYYVADTTANNLTQLRSGSAVVLGGLAWFWGPSDGGKGQESYRLYIEKVQRMKARDHFLVDSEKKFGPTRHERRVRQRINEIRQNRS